MKPAHRFTLLLATCLATLGCTESSAVAPQRDSASAAQVDVAPGSAQAASTGAPVPVVEPWRIEFLDLAFDVASAFPVNPHIKNRSRAQVEVVLAALEVDQPDLALRYAAGIANWRRGEALGAFAHHQARHGRLARVQEFLDEAQRIADGGGLPADPTAGGDGIEVSQEWRRDRIRAWIARTYLVLGQSTRADGAAEGTIDAESVPIHAQRARSAPEAEFEAEVRRLDALVAAGSFDPLRAALGAYAELYGRFFLDAEKRALLEERVATALAKMPVQLRVDAYCALAGHALAHESASKARELLDLARAAIEAARWDAETSIPLVARVATLRARAGDREAASGEVEFALDAYAKERERIVNMYRGGVLRPLAEACVAMGDEARARAIYARALEEAVVNPNSRPRADDLVATIASMVVQGLRPDESLEKRIREIRAGLGDPW
ncbi:MAG: hypothetical protein JNK02_00590 [Planctomycetes bacterium]|nr:hypothetical protein [Planctomycetota bacterium]